MTVLSFASVNFLTGIAKKKLGKLI